jgi:hypothetical protein
MATTEIKCPKCNTDVDISEITEAKLDRNHQDVVYKASRDFTGDITTLTPQITKRAHLPCGCEITVVS